MKRIVSFGLVVFMLGSLFVHAEKGRVRHKLPEVTNMHGVKVLLKRDGKTNFKFRVENHTDKPISFIRTNLPVDLKLGMLDEEGKALDSIYSKNQFSSMMGEIKPRSFYEFSLDLRECFTAQSLKRGKFLTGVFSYKVEKEIVSIPFRVEFKKVK